MKAIGTQMLQTERLILRRFVESDAEAMFQNWASSAENLTYVTWDPHPDVDVTRNSIRNWVDSYANPNYYKWAICLKENPGQVIRGYQYRLRWMRKIQVVKLAMC